MPVIDTAPILMAKEKGYFEKLGLEVNTEIYSHASSRQSALQSQTVERVIIAVIAVVTKVSKSS